MLPSGQPLILDFQMEPQKRSRWCWAAIAAAMGQFYQTSRWTQDQVAGALLGFDCSALEGAQSDQDSEAALLGQSDAYNVNRKLDEALKFTNSYSHWSLGKPLFERIQLELDAGRPPCVRIEWYNGGAHYIVVVGYNAHTQEIFIEDPRAGFSRQRFASFPREYGNDGGVWTETFWTVAAAMPPS